MDEKQREGVLVNPHCRLSESQVRLVDEVSRELLEDPGLLCFNKEAASIFRNAGASVEDADLVVGAVLKPGAKAPYLITKEMIGKMRKGSVVVDVAIDQGGCIETSRPTDFSSPTFKVDGVIHYCVANMPSAVARTATFALSNATLPYVLDIADKGLIRASEANPALAKGINVCHGNICHMAVAESLGAPYLSWDKAMGLDKAIAGSRSI